MSEASTMELKPTELSLSCKSLETPSDWMPLLLSESAPTSVTEAKAGGAQGCHWVASISVYSREGKLRHKELQSVT